MNTDHSEKSYYFTARLANNIWFSCLLIFAILLTRQIFLMLFNGHVSTIELSQFLAALMLSISWLSFKPAENISNLRSNADSSIFHFQNELYSETTKLRMIELQRYHMISQEYIFPFSYLCQIYHLLNLKHLESVHSFSLNNLKIIKVSEFKPTASGGLIKFQTALESPLNSLRIWRQSLVEVDLILHTPYTVELNIPAYNDKRIIVIFNILPLEKGEHKLLIDIYSNLAWPKPVLQLLLHLASCVTVFEDLPYLRKLAAKNLERLVCSNNISDHDTMRLFKRFAELYGAGA